MSRHKMDEKAIRSSFDVRNSGKQQTREFRMRMVEAMKEVRKNARKHTHTASVMRYTAWNYLTRTHFLLIDELHVSGENDTNQINGWKALKVADERP